MYDTEVLIIGGGPAGSTLAKALREAGKSVAVMDKAYFPRDKVCAGWVTPAVMRELDIDLQAYAHDKVLQPIHGFRTGQLGQSQLQTDFPGEPVSYGIRRIEFDNYLLQRCGAELFLGQALRSMQQQRDGWLINDEIRANLVVGAGGHFCPVARAIGAKKPRETAVAAQEIEFRMSPQQRSECLVSGKHPELFFTPDLKGYGWVFRKGDYLNIGLGREDKHRLSWHMDRFRKYLETMGRIPHELPGKLRGHAYLLYPRAQRAPVGDRVLLIGDSAGLAYAQSGEGIRPAVESALLAAQTILECHGDYTVGRLQTYLDRLERRFGRRQSQADTNRLNSPRIRQTVAKVLMKSRWFSKNFLIKRWFLHSQDRPLPASGNHAS